MKFFQFAIYFLLFINLNTQNNIPGFGHVIELIPQVFNIIFETPNNKKENSKIYLILNKNAY